MVSFDFTHAKLIGGGSMPKSSHLVYLCLFLVVDRLLISSRKQAFCNMGRPKTPIEIKEKRGTVEKSRELSPGERMKPEKVALKASISVPDFLNKYGRTFYKFYYSELTKLN